MSLVQILSLKTYQMNDEFLQKRIAETGHDFFMMLLGLDIALNEYTIFKI